MANETEEKKDPIQPRRISIDIGRELWPCVRTLKSLGHRALSEFIREAFREHWKERGPELERQSQAAQAEQEQMAREARKIYEEE